MPNAMNVNTATAAELDTIEGLAGHGFEIARYREERGRFDDLRQLDEVRGCPARLVTRPRPCSRSRYMAGRTRARVPYGPERFPAL